MDAIQLASAPAIEPVARVPVAGTLSFLSRGDLLVLERRWETMLALGKSASGKESRVVVHQLAAATWQEVAERSIGGLRGSPIGCAASPDGAAVAAGYKVVKLVDWPDGKAIASLKGIRYQIERASIGFSPSGTRLAVGDGGYVQPANRWVRVYSALDGSELAKVQTDEFSVKQVAMPDDRTIVVRGLRHDYQYASRSEPQHVLACYDVATLEARWRRRYWSVEHRFALDAARGHLWTSGDHVVRSDDHVGGVERGLECISSSDGSSVAAVELGDLVYPQGVLAFVAGRAIATLRTSDGSTGVFAVDAATGALTRLAGATGLYGACHAASGRAALSISRTETGIYAFSR